MAFSLNTQTVGDDGAPVVFLPGLFGQGKNFSTIAKSLRPELKSVLVDLPNHGDSDWTETFDYVEQADLIAEHLKDGIAAQGPVALVGHSMGGKTAMVLALRHPDLISRLTVVDISPVDRPEMDEFEHLLDALLGLDLSETESRRDADEQLKGPIPQDMVRGFLMQSLSTGSDGLRWKPNLRLLRESLPAIGGFPQMEAQYDGPVLWIAGAESDYVDSDQHGDAMRELFPRTRLFTVKDAGHWVHAEQPDIFTEILKGFLTADR